MMTMGLKETGHVSVAQMCPSAETLSCVSVSDQGAFRCQRSRRPADGGGAPYQQAKQGVEPDGAGHQRAHQDGHHHASPPRRKQLPHSELDARARSQLPMARHSSGFLSAAIDAE